MTRNGRSKAPPPDRCRRTARNWFRRGDLQLPPAPIASQRSQRAQPMRSPGLPQWDSMLARLRSCADGAMCRSAHTWPAGFGLAMNGAESRLRPPHGAVRPIWRPFWSNCRAAASLLKPPSVTLRHRLSTFWRQRRTLKLRNLSFLGSDRMDNLLKAQLDRLNRR